MTLDNKLIQLAPLEINNDPFLKLEQMPFLPDSLSNSEDYLYRMGKSRSTDENSYSSDSSDGENQETLQHNKDTSDLSKIEAKNKSKLRKRQKHMLHYAIRCNNIANWKISSNSPRIQGLNFKIMEGIYYRESLLLKLKNIATIIESHYWKYCADRVRLVERERSINSEDMLIRRNQMYVLQQQISVGIAHYRSVSITILETIQKIRYYIGKEIKTLASISIYWHGKNYLLKMANDINFLFEFSTMRYWLGFIPNPLMVPPIGHDPKSRWKDYTAPLLQQYLSSYRDKIAKEKRSATVRARKALAQARMAVSMFNPGLSTSVSFDGDMSATTMPGISPEFMQTDGSESLSNKYSLTFQKATTPTNLSRRNRTQSAAAVLQEWEQLRDYCNMSWSKACLVDKRWPPLTSKGTLQRDELGKDEDEVWVQSSYLNPLFWENYDHNPYVVEAALGFSEMFPLVHIVPSLPKEIEATCTKLLAVIAEEAITMKHLELKKKEVTAKFEEFKSTWNDDAIAQSLYEKSHMIETQISELDRLRFRQQGNSQVLQGISLEYVEKEFPLTIENNKMKLVEPQADDQYLDGRIFGLTKVDGPHSQSKPNLPDMSLLSLFNTEDSLASDFQYRHLTSSLVNLQSLKPFQLESSQSLVRSMLESRVNDSRCIVTRGEDNVSLVLREDRAGRREANRLDVKWLHKHVINIQRIVRGFLGRRRARSRRLREMWSDTIIVLQTFVRAFIRRLRKKREIREQKLQTFLLRKEATKQFRAAITIGRCIRQFVNLKRIHKNEPLLYDRVDHFGQPLTKRHTHMRLRDRMGHSHKESLEFHSSPYRQALISDNEAVPAKPVDSSFRRSVLLSRSNNAASKSFPNKAAISNQTGSTGLESTSSTQSSLSKSMPRLNTGPSVMGLGQVGKSKSQSALLEAAAAASEEIRKKEAEEEEAALDRLDNQEAEASNNNNADDDLSTDSFGSQSGSNLLVGEGIDTLMFESGPVVDLAEKQRMERLRAVAFVKRLNQGKVHLDTVRNCRLIPSTEVSINKVKKAKMRLARKELSLLNLGAKPKSLVNNPNDIYIPPNVNNNSASRPVTSSAMSTLKRDDVSVGSGSFSGNGALSSFSHSLDYEERNRKKEIREDERFRGVLNKYLK